MSDTQLRKDVLDELDFEPSVNATNIGVAVDNGVVTLAGHVSNYAQKGAAVQAARRVKGVRAIADEIEVRFASDRKTSDDEIAKRVLDILRWSDVPNDVIVTVRNGIVTLGGEVGWKFEKVAAENAVRKLNGVRAVANVITIKPRVSIPDVKQRIENALRRSAEVEAKGIHISVHDGGHVVLEGKVRDLFERDAVQTAAWSAPGVTIVEDKLGIF